MTEKSTSAVRHRRTRRRAAAPAAVLAVTIAAVATAGCGGSGQVHRDVAATGKASGSAPALAHPAKLALLWEVKGESVNGIDDYDNGAKLAVDEINRAGGVGGHPLQTVRFPASVVDPQALVGSFLKAADAKPAVIIGMPGLTIEAAAVQFDRVGIPVIGNTTDDALKYGAKMGSQWFFEANPAASSDDASAVRYAAEGLHAHRVGLLNTNEVYGTSGATVIKRLLADAGVTLAGSASYSPTTTDLTREILAVKDADAVIHWGYPNTIVLQLKQFLQNGVTIPTVSTPGAAIAVANGLAQGAELDKLYGVAACNLAQPTRPATKSFVDAYQARYGYPPTTAAAIAYDSVHVAAAAIETAGSTEPAAVRDALAKVSYTDGACSPDYHADGAHVLNHSDVVVSFAGGAARTVAAYTYPDEPKLGG